MQTTQEQRRAFQLKTLKSAAPVNHSAYEWLGAILFAFAFISLVGGILGFFIERQFAFAVIGVVFALFLFAGGAIINLLIDIERNQRISHELQIRQLERMSGSE